MYAKQIGFIMHGGGINVRAYAEQFKREGYVVVFRDGHTTAHEPEPKKDTHAPKKRAA